MYPSKSILDLPPQVMHPSTVLGMLLGQREIGRDPGHHPSTAWAQPASTASLSGVIEKVPFIQKSTIPDSIKLQTNEEGGKKNNLFDYSVYWRRGGCLTWR